MRGFASSAFSAVHQGIFKKMSINNACTTICVLDVTRAVEYDERGAPLSDPSEFYFYSLLECGHGLDVCKNQY